jgi:hypothetical protein
LKPAVDNNFIFDSILNMDKLLVKKHINKQLYKSLASWAAECAGHVLPYFEKKYPEDKRPRRAIKELRKWMRTGKFSMEVIRKASLDAHAAARKAKDDAARFAARAAGQAAAAAHVPAHAISAYYYALKAVKAAGSKCKRRKKLMQPPKNVRPVIVNYFPLK